MIVGTHQTSSSIGTEKETAVAGNSREMFSPFGRDVFHKVTGATAFSHSDTRNGVETQDSTTIRQTKSRIDSI